MTERLLVEAVVPEIAAALADAGSAVVVAEPGAGKTTIVPWRLLAAPWLEGRKIIMLEPRRIAARAAAARIAWHLGEPVGATVGYRVRFDTRVSARTRIEVVTEGVLTRLLQDDPSLEAYGLVILDEFHERSIAADLGLALTLQSRAVLRPDLRILVMSATIDAPAVARVLGDAWTIEAPGRVFPVETRYRPPVRPDSRLESQVTQVIREAVHAESGDVLVFLPGVGEIRRVEEFLRDGSLDAEVLPLHGTLPTEAQDAALAPGRRRRIILATAIAETSLTVPGVRIVIDAGRIRAPRFSPRTGMTRLETLRVTRASADQRRGRAGRTEPGVCYRLWSPAEEAGFLAHRTPEILDADLASLALELAGAGVRDPAELDWLDPPPAAALAQARGLLTLLGALDGAGTITVAGRRMAALPLHPRLAHMAVRARDEGHGALAALLVAILSDRDPARRVNPHEPPDADLRLRVDGIEAGRTPPGFELDRVARLRLRDEAREWRRRLDVPPGEKVDIEACGRLLGWAYPDRVAQRRGGTGRFLLENGRGAALPASQPLAREDFLVAAELDDVGAESRILLAAPLDRETLDELVTDAGLVEQVVEWDDARGAVRAVEQTRLGAIVLAEKPVATPDPDRVRSVLLDAVRRGGIGSLPWTDVATAVRQRLGFLHHHDPVAWPDVSDAALLATLESWLGPALGTGSLAGLDMSAVLLGMLPHQSRGRLDRLAPERWEVPTGSRLAIDYGDPAAPVLPVRLQEMFGEARTPAVLDGKVPLTVHLLSPAGRPVQVTRDLAGFWKNSYFDVRKDMKGRYPKHEWPENPLEATPTRRVKRRR